MVTCLLNPHYLPEITTNVSIYIQFKFKSYNLKYLGYYCKFFYNIRRPCGLAISSNSKI